MFAAFLLIHLTTKCYDVGQIFDKPLPILAATAVKAKTSGLDRCSG